MEKLYKLSEVAEMLRVSKTTIYRFLYKGKLKGFKTGEAGQSEWRIPESTIEKFMEVK